MKKLKWIFLVLVIFLMILIVISSCKKTKAYTNNIDDVLIYDLHNLEQDQSFCAIFSINSQNIYYLSLFQGNNLAYFVDYADGYIRVVDRTWNVLGYLYYNSNSFNGLIYCQLVCDYTNETNALYIGYIEPTYTNRQDESPIISDFSLYGYSGVNNSLNNIKVDLSINFSQSYYVNHNISFAFNYNNDTTYALRGLIYCGLYDIYDFSNTYSSQVSNLFSDIKVNVPTLFANMAMTYAYSQGYNRGYDYGDLVGYARGFNEGSDDGYNDGYAAGYDDGLADNQTAYDIGYDDGYTTGYNTGYTEGESGESAVSKAVGVIGSIFGAIGTVLAIQLFPGIPLGLFFLVPLFFAVIGLILWIWRRN